MYENINGANLIFDTLTSTTWTQNADISSQTFTQQAAAAWASNLVVPGVADAVWTLPTATQFTSLYTQLDPVGPPGTENDKYGTTVLFGTGPNDFASNVETTYWTSTAGTDFNFFYGYPGQPTTPDLSAWAVMAPEPSSIALLGSGFAGVGGVFLRRRRNCTR